MRHAIKSMLGCLAAALAVVALRPAPAQSEPAARHVTSAEEASARGLALATFAGGCFWCVEADFTKLAGVIEAVSGYTGGKTPNPSYEQVAWGRTGHVEAVQVTFDPKVLSYPRLVEHYWRHVDPLDGRGQFCDRGAAYRPFIFTHSPEQAATAEASRDALARSGRFREPIAVTIKPASEFWPAEIEHQGYAQKRPWRYAYYRHGCGRDARLDAVWGKDARLTPEQPATN